MLDVPEPSKVAALNAADAEASRWPRLYLDADIEIDPRALRRSSTSSDVGLCWPLVPPFASTRKAPAGSCAPFTGQGTEFPRLTRHCGERGFRSFPGRAQTVRRVPLHFATIQR